MSLGSVLLDTSLGLEVLAPARVASGVVGCETALGVTLSFLPFSFFLPTDR